MTKNKFYLYLPKTALQCDFLFRALIPSLSQTHCIPNSSPALSSSLPFFPSHVFPNKYLDYFEPILVSLSQTICTNYNIMGKCSQYIIYIMSCSAPNNNK